MDSAPLTPGPSSHSRYLNDILAIHDNTGYDTINDGSARNVHTTTVERTSLSYQDTPLTCSEKVKKQIKQRFPILGWFPKYKKGQLLADIISGITVGLTVVPQSMAYASIAGLTPEYGLYSSYIGCFLYVIFGSCRQVTIGPTAVMGLLTFETCGTDFPACAILTGFYSGIFELCMALLQLGWVVSFISEPVVIGFTTGAAFTIISSQVKNFIGLSGPKGSGFMGYWQAIINSIGTINLSDAVMGVSSFVILLLLKQLNQLKFSHTHRGKTLKKICWLISVARNVIIVVFTSLIAYLWPSGGFKLTGKVLGGFPPVGMPSFNLPTNSTSEDYHSFIGTWTEVLGVGPLVVALISVLQNVAISKAFGSGQSIDATQEMLALGLSNACGGFFSSIAISGSFSRSAVNEASGVQSQLGGLFTGCLVLLSLGFLTPTFYFIPKASLAAVIISAVSSMIELEAVPIMWKISRMDMIACTVTFLCSIFIGMEYGIMIGVVISLLVLLMKSLKTDWNPELLTDPRTGIEYLFTKPGPGLSFTTVDFIRSSVTKLTGRFHDVPIICISFEKWTSFDYTVVTAIASLVKNLKKENKLLIFVDCNQSWINAFETAGLADIPHSSLYDLSDYLRKLKYDATDKITGDDDGATHAIEESPIKSKSKHSSGGGDYGAVIVSVDDNDSETVINSAKPLL